MKHIEAGDIVAHLRSFQGGLETSWMVGKVSTAYTVIEPLDGVDAAYYRWVFKSSAFIQELASSTQQLRDGQSVKFDDFAAIPLPQPPMDEQRRIAAFLDTRVAEIDRIISARRRQIQLTRATAKALRQLVTEAAGPVMRLRFVCSPVDSRAEVEGHPLLAVSIHHGVVRRDSIVEALPRAEDLSNYKVVATGDLVLNRMRAFQGAVGVAREPGVVSPDYLVLRCSEAIDPEWLDLLFRSPWFVGQMAARIRGIGSVDSGNVRTPRVNWSELSEIGFEVPSKDEQGRIAHEQHDRERRLMDLGSALEASAALMAEYKSSLISAAVTGELDVPTTGSGIPA